MSLSVICLIILYVPSDSSIALVLTFEGGTLSHDTSWQQHVQTSLSYPIPALRAIAWLSSSHIARASSKWSVHLNILCNYTKRNFPPFDVVIQHYQRADLWPAIAATKKTDHCSVMQGAKRYVLPEMTTLYVIEACLGGVLPPSNSRV